MTWMRDKTNGANYMANFVSSVHGATNLQYCVPSSPMTISSSNHRCCAERRLLTQQMRAAVRHGVAPHQRITWARRKFGCHIAVVRPRGDGTLGCSVPCVLCRAALIKHDVTVHVIVDPASKHWYHGRLTEHNAPMSKPTSGQVKRMGFVGSSGL